jgi:DNA repair protein RecO (recombination protein O)
MALESDRCLCVRKLEYSETSQILTLFSRDHGLVRVIAKGAHRRTKAGASRFDGGIDLLDIGQAVFTGDTSRDLATLTEWKLIEGHLGLRQNLRGLYLGIYTAELISTLIEEHDAHPDLFDRVACSIADLGTARAEQTFLALQLDLLRETGFLPELSACIECGTGLNDRDGVYFSPSRGGVVCRNCEAAIPDRMNVDLRLIRLAGSILRLPRSEGVPQRLPQLTRHQTDPLNRLFSEHIQHTLGRRLRMISYILRSTQRKPATSAAGAH